MADTLCCNDYPWDQLVSTTSKIVHVMKEKAEVVVCLVAVMVKNIIHLEVMVVDIEMEVVVDGVGCCYGGGNGQWRRDCVTRGA